MGNYHILPLPAQSTPHMWADGWPFLGNCTIVVGFFHYDLETKIEAESNFYRND